MGIEFQFRSVVCFYKSNPKVQEFEKLRNVYTESYFLPISFGCSLIFSPTAKHLNKQHKNAAQIQNAEQWDCKM